MRIKRALAFACGTCLLVAGLAPAPAFAGKLQINTVLLEVNASRRTAMVTLRNEEAEPVTIRAYALEWNQQGGEESYADTSAVIVSPPIFTIAPGATQLIRVGLRSPSGAPRAYRLIVEEVPEARPAGGIRVALRLNLPLYSMIPAGEVSSLRWSAWQEQSGWVLEAVNSGPGYVRLSQEAAQAATGVRATDNVNFGTVLPGATRRWRIGPQPDVRDQSRFRQIARTQGHVAAQASLH